MGDRRPDRRSARRPRRRGQGRRRARPSPPAAAVAPPKHDRFKTPQNLLGVLFLGVFAFNLLIMAIDFPRFTIVAVVFLIGFVVFFILWIGAYFDYDLMEPVADV